MGRSRSDGTYFERGGEAEILALFHHPLPEEVDSVRTRENDPVVGFKPVNRAVHFSPTERRDNLNRGKLDDFCPTFLKPGRKIPRLAKGSGDQNSFSEKGFPIHFSNRNDRA